ncbi:MAG: carboxypeptidase-like regulatory domain-containing protein [Nitrospira sp.]|nr:carboxypeptidase-like regulatory domain-containing protein [Nitrospira sp.]MCP9442702.1 carboxypeptidase-like regulatory domain-containing protein [Nitrospira sp.]
MVRGYRANVGGGYRPLCVILAMTACLVWADAAHAYTVKDVQHGGTLTGKVTLVGEVPEPRGFNLITFPDPEYCGRISNGKGWRLLYDFAVDAEGGLKNAIVLFEEVEAGKPFEVSVPLIEARDCTFSPFMTVVRNGHAVEVVNMDPVMHDIQGYETSLVTGARVIFNSPLIMNHQHRRGDLRATHNHAPGKSLIGPIRLSAGRRMFYMQCGFHAYMESWAMAVDNPYYALTDEHGHYTIEDIPPGTYHVVVWHPRTGPGQSVTVVIKPDDHLTRNFVIQAPKGNWTAYRVVENPRFGLEALGYPVDIQPLVELQR